MCAEDALSARVSSLAEDFILALRYHYYVKSAPIVPDDMYDQIEKEWLAREGVDTFSTPVNLPGSDKADDYSDRVKALALYLSFAMQEELRMLPERKKKYAQKAD